MKRGVSTKSVAIGEDIVQGRLSALSAKRQFISTAMNMGWQLAGAVLLPVIIGVKLDDHFKTTPSYTLVSLFLACGGAVGIVWGTIKQVGEDQAEEDKIAAQQKVTKEEKNDN